MCIIFFSVFDFVSNTTTTTHVEIFWEKKNFFSLDFFSRVIVCVYYCCRCVCVCALRSRISNHETKNKPNNFISFNNNLILTKKKKRKRIIKWTRKKNFPHLKIDWSIIKKKNRHFSFVRQPHIHFSSVSLHLSLSISSCVGDKSKQIIHAHTHTYKHRKHFQTTWNQ